MRTRNRLLLVLLALDAGRWWASDSIRDRTRYTLGAIDERWYRLYQSALRHLEPGPPEPGPMDRVGERDRAEIEWAALVARLRAGAYRDGTPPP